MSKIDNEKELILEMSQDMLNRQEETHKSEIASLKAEHKECVDAVREESIAIGKLDKIKYDSAHNELLKYAIIFNVKQRIKHSRSGMTWDQFLDRIGEAKKTVDKTLKDIRPIVENYSENFTAFLNIPFNKIRYLGRSIDAGAAAVNDGNILIDGVQIPLSPDSKDDIEAAIDAMKEAHAKEKKAVSDKLKKLEKDKDRIISEETKKLRITNDLLVKENERLKAFDPQDKDISWSIEQVEALEKSAHDFMSGCDRFMMDDRLKEADHIEIQARVQVRMDMMKRCLEDLIERWDEAFNSDWE